MSVAATCGSRFMIAVLFGAIANGAHAQTGWRARVTGEPNPLPAGQCATLRVEPVDDHGYRRASLSNGASLDFRAVAYASSDVTHFVVRNDATMWGGVCANADAPSGSSTTVTVTLPDGVKGQIQIFVVAKGEPRPPPVVYAAQPPLRLPGSPEYAPGFEAQRQQIAAGGGAPTVATPTVPAGAVASAEPSSAAPGSMHTSSQIVDTTASRKAPVASLSQAARTITTPALSLTGMRHVPAAVSIASPALSLIGTAHVPPAATVTTVTMSLTGLHVGPVVTVVNHATPVGAASQQPHSP